MSNNFFRFKQFIIHQDKCAMKVCTDACLFGAWGAHTIQNLIPKHRSNIQNILDIGTGTGLLSLMLAQKNPHVIIDAVEIDELTAQQANQNFKSSPWKKRLSVHQTNIQQFNTSTYQPYDLIISNPPFFENHLKSKNDTKNLALHSEALSLEELIIYIKNNLTNNGIGMVLLPHNRSSYFEQLIVNHQFYINDKILIKQTPNHNYFRYILTFSKQHTEIEITSITIQDMDNKYTTTFIELLKDYYLNL